MVCAAKFRLISFLGLYNDRSFLTLFAALQPLHQPSYILLPLLAMTKNDTSKVKKSKSKEQPQVKAQVLKNPRSKAAARLEVCYYFKKFTAALRLNLAQASATITRSKQAAAKATSPCATLEAPATKAGSRSKIKATSTASTPAIKSKKATEIKAPVPTKKPKKIVEIEAPVPTKKPKKVVEIQAPVPTKKPPMKKATARKTSARNHTSGIKSKDTKVKTAAKREYRLPLSSKYSHPILVSSGSVKSSPSKSKKGKPTS